MSKKNKIVIAVVTVAVVATLVGVLSWGLQPVLKDSVSLKKLNQKLGDRYEIPTQMPFEGDTQCYIVYHPQHPTLRFELRVKNATGYVIECKDTKRNIIIQSLLDHGNPTLSGEENVIETTYKNQKVLYRIEKDHVRIQFNVNEYPYEIIAEYDQSVEQATMKADIEKVMSQIIK